MIKLIGKSEQVALIGKNISYSYNQILTHINQFADLLENVKGQRIVIFSENRPEWIIALYAAWKKGALVVPIDVLSSHEDVAYIMQDCSPKVVFCSREKSEFIHQVLTDVRHKAEVLVFDNLTANETVEEINDFTIDDPERTALIL